MCSKADYSLFTFHRNDVFLILLIYVDDILVMGNNTNYFSLLIKTLGRLFSMKDLGPLIYYYFFYFFLGLEVVHTSSRISLTQTKYSGPSSLD